MRKETLDALVSSIVIALGSAFFTGLVLVSIGEDPTFDKFDKHEDPRSKMEQEIRDNDTKILRELPVDPMNLPGTIKKGEPFYYNYEETRQYFEDEARYEEALQKCYLRYKTFDNCGDYTSSINTP